MKTPNLRDGQIKSFKLDDYSTSAVRAVGGGRPKKAIDDNGRVKLQAIETVSILGKHNGLMDDDLFDMIADKAAD